MTRQAVRRLSDRAVPFGWGLAAILPLVGLTSLLLRSHLDPNFTNPRLHFVLFMIVGGLASMLAYAAGNAADRRGDARVLLLSLAFLATGLFLLLHAVGTTGILFTEELAGFHVAIPVGLLLAAMFGAASAFVDYRPRYAPLVIRHRKLLRRSVIGAVVLWCVWTIGKFAGLESPTSEGAAGSTLGILAALATALYAASGVRYLYMFRERMGLLPASVVACFVLLAEAMIGVATTGERSWHASWWEWHGLIVLAFLIIFFAARREWRDERFRKLYLSTTRERAQEVSVLFSDLAGFTTYSAAATPAQVAQMLGEYYEIAAPLISKQFGGEVEKFMGDGVMATFNTRGDQTDHAVRAAGAALALQRELSHLADEHDGWPRVRVGVNSGPAVVRELGGSGYVAYAVVGDTVNMGSRLESNAPVGGVLIGKQTYDSLPDGTVARLISGLLVKGKDSPIDAFVLQELPTRRRISLAS
ncbi:MAG: adenylate/guanylate cyclase domain-containing protein [Actinomycetota bacterium]|nr:adenylate/guanylate cyclase domain-containing protein [Actinomycetota bacterium]